MATSLGIDPCLPVAPSAALLQLVLEPAQRRDLILALVGAVYQVKASTPLSQDLQLWCVRLTKALMPNTLQISTQDPLHYLRAWVEPSVWQRLRLSFDRQRVLALEVTPRLSETHDKLETIWKAAIWRTGASNNEPVFSFAEESQDDVVQTHD
ncbi:type III secretion protein [Pseudomonas sp. ChxA]|uniref:type III secretion protein n=1 Tax=Pseudomonas sp. ChxA TaxID=3035473 RepID=UPI002555F19B|nr:type III secretion protein [Pseudomonas sp. ChxA]MDL2188322.1 type III secretion protein [Pseudomonas sp. ChxA]